jgi:hypothetical protein
MDAQKTSFASKVIGSRGHLLYTLKGTDAESGRKAYWFLLVDSHKLNKFEIALEDGTFNLEDYGKIVESGFGEEIPQSAKDKLKEEYGFEVD